MRATSPFSNDIAMTGDAERAGAGGEPGRSAPASTFALRAEELRRTTITARRILRAFDSGVAAIDPDRIAGLEAYVAAHPASTSDPLEAKYLDLPLYLKDKARWLVDLRLDDAAPQSILDLGMGGGHFPFLAKAHGHRVLGIDLDVSLYSQILEAYDVTRLVHRIEPDAPLPVDDRFDLITALQITFNRKPGIAHSEEGGAYWTEAEWATFIDELCRHLVYPGRIFFNFNRQTMPSGEHHADMLLDLFEANGARVDFWKYTALLELTGPITLRA